MIKEKQKITELIDEKLHKLKSASDKIWEYAEVRFDTKKSAGLFTEILNEEGFSVEKEPGGIINSFIASFGHGKPVIGILAEYDALGSMNQVADCEYKKSSSENTPGHGCGHNLLGTGSLGAAIALKDYMELHHLNGTIKLFGCPAEESGYGKAYMAKAGLFSALDAALSWHPADISSGWAEGTLAVLQAYFKFKGISAHAASAPFMGRSALDAAEIMNIGANYLREHVPDFTRIHYAYIDAGGESANVVPASSKLHYFIRAPKQETVENIYKRLCKIAQGAALITETEVEISVDSACMNYIPNMVLSRLMYDNFKEISPIDFTEKDYEYAKRYHKGLNENQISSLRDRLKAAFKDKPEDWISEMLENSLNPYLPEMADGGLGMMSTDVGDVSWIVPTGQVNIACEPHGTTPHSWQWVANGLSGIAHKGIEYSAKVIAMTGLDILMNPEIAEKALEEHHKNLSGKAYHSLIPDGKLPE